MAAVNRVLGKHPRDASPPPAARGPGPWQAQRPGGVADGQQARPSGSDVGAILGLELPVARVRRVMKMDESVRTQTTVDTPLLLTRAAELFVKQLTREAWAHTVAGGRRTLQRCDLTAACMYNEVYDFLLELLPRDDVYPFVANFLDTPPAVVATAATAGPREGRAGSASAAAAGPAAASRAAGSTARGAQAAARVVQATAMPSSGGSDQHADGKINANDAENAPVPADTVPATPGAGSTDAGVEEAGSSDAALAAEIPGRGDSSTATQATTAAPGMPLQSASVG